jgi:hypothetical protein
MAEDEAQDQPGEEGAAEAFEALRVEVAQLRASVEGLPATLKGPDYAPTLGAIAQTLAAIEAHPALQIVPESFAYQLRQAREAAQQQGQRDLTQAVQRVDGAAAELGRLVQGERIGREQNRWLAITTGLGAVAGVVAWVALSGPIARTLPARWRVPEKMAAATLRLDRWEAGARLMRSADPISWNGVAAASQLSQENTDRLGDCRRVADKTGKAQRCIVTLEPEPAGRSPGR